MMNRSVLSALTCLAVGVATAAEVPPWPTESWPRSSPERQGLRSAPLESLVETIRANREIRNVHSLLIVRNGWLVLEEYFHGHDADELHELQSVSKSFTSALVGIAIARGKIEGVEERVLSFFPELQDVDNLDDRKRRMTLEDLLTMRSGTDYHERGRDSPHDQLNRKSRGWTEFILDRPMISKPGTTFRYDSGAVILTSAILHARYGVHADRFAAEHLFAPLGIDRHAWYRNAEGHPHTGGGLDLRSRDMAKFGLLYLRKGRWDGKQVVPAAWVAASLSRQVEFEEPRDGAVGYGYWWWVLPPDPDGDGKQDIYGAMGFKGQYILLVPEHDMVVVVTAGGRSHEEEDAPREFLYSHILEAAHPRPASTGSAPDVRPAALPKPTRVDAAPDRPAGRPVAADGEAGLCSDPWKRARLITKSIFGPDSGDRSVSRSEDCHRVLPRREQGPSAGRGEATGRSSTQVTSSS